MGLSNHRVTPTPAAHRVGKELLLVHIPGRVEWQGSQLASHLQVLAVFGFLQQRGRDPQLGQLQRVRDERHAQLVGLRLPAGIQADLDALAIGWEVEGDLRAAQEAGGEIVHAERHRVDAFQEFAGGQIGDSAAGAIAAMSATGYGTIL